MPTYLQKQAFKRVLKGSKISRAMKKVGYADSTATTTGKLTSSKGWQELVEKYLPDSDLIKIHKQGLKATKVITSHTEPDREYPDYAIRHKYLETAYKLKNRLENWGEEDEKPQFIQNILVLIEKVYGGENGDNSNASISEGSELSQTTS